MSFRSGSQPARSFRLAITGTASIAAMKVFGSILDRTTRWTSKTSCLNRVGEETMGEELREEEGYVCLGGRDLCRGILPLTR